MNGPPVVSTPGCWRAALDAPPVRPLDPAGFGPVTVLAAHPDDETLAVGALLRTLHRPGTQVRLVVATDGEAAYPELDASGRAALGRARRAELAEALRRLGLDGVDVRWLGLPDSALEPDMLAEALDGLLDGAESYLAPWPGDPHPDHAAVGHAAAAVAPAHTRGWSYPIWMWPWRRPDDPEIPWSRAHLHHLDPGDRVAKRSALRAFRSQVEPTPDGGPPVLPPEVLAHFETDRELLFREPRTTSAPEERFAALYRGGADPWATRDSWYERRKRSVLLACLPRERYRHAAEPGCGTGELTAELAGRCDRVDASDLADEAVRMARARTAGLSGVVVGRCRLPEGIPDGVDLLVLSEVLYYLADADLARVLDRLCAATSPPADVVVAHWRGWPAEAPMEAVEIHRRLAAHSGLTPLVEHTDEEFLLSVYRRR